MKVEVRAIPAKAEWKGFTHFLLRKGQSDPALYAFFNKKEDESESKRQVAANASVFLHVNPHGRAAVVGKRFESNFLTSYLAWEGELSELIEFLSEAPSSKKAASGLMTFLKAKNSVIKESENGAVKESYYEPTFDSIVSAFKSVGVDDIYGIFGIRA